MDEESCERECQESLLGGIIFQVRELKEDHYAGVPMLDGRYEENGKDLGIEFDVSVNEIEDFDEMDRQPLRLYCDILAGVFRYSASDFY